MRALAFGAVLCAATAWAQQRPTTLFSCEPDPSGEDSDAAFSVFLESHKKAEPEVKFIRSDVEQVAPPDNALDYLNGIGAPGRCWEITSDTSFGNRRVFTQRFEVARAFKVPRRSLAAVLRVGFGGDAQVNTGAYAIQGVEVAVGLKHYPLSGFSLEYGLRLIPGWSGPQDREAEIQALALGATLTSGLGNDPAWLPFSKTGLQLYVDFQTRSGMWVLSPGWALMLGARYGGSTSLGDFQVHTWLGPQTAFIGNVYVEAYLGAPLLRDVLTSLQLGLHVDVSISSIWPGAQAFPLAWYGYIGWAPLSWFSFRAHIGNGMSLGSKDVPVLMYGLRLQLALP